MDKKPLILIVEDEPFILTLYKKALTDAGFEVITATNGEEGIEKAKVHHPHLILMDVKMPVMDGVQAFTKIEEDPQTRGTKVIFISAFGDPQLAHIDIKTAKELGALDFIKKGIEIDELVNKVKAALS